jgi:hypothetical protein
MLKTKHTKNIFKFIIRSYSKPNVGFIGLGNMGNQNI